MTPPDVTAVLNLSREGLLARASIDSFMKAIATADVAGVACEAIVVLDSADERTREFVDAYPIAPDRQIRIDCRDLGAARNAAAQAGSGRWITFLDGDDLWGPDWIAASCNLARLHHPKTIWHPEFNVYFGDERKIVRHPDMDEEEFDPATLAIANCWTALCFASLDLVRSIPYRRANAAAQIGFEDWAWNIETAVQGARHKIVPGTLHAIRSRSNSLGRNAVANLSRPDFPQGAMSFFKSGAARRRDKVATFAAGVSGSPDDAKHMARPQ